MIEQANHESELGTAVEASEQKEAARALNAALKARTPEQKNEDLAKRVQRKNQSRLRQPPQSRPVMLHTLALKTKESQQVYSVNFGVVAQSFVELSLKYPAYQAFKSEANKEALIGILSHFCDQYDDLLAAMNEAKARLEKVLIDNGMADSQRVTYTTPLVIDERVNTPHLFRVIRVLSALDDLVSLIDTAWMYGLLDDRAASMGKREHTGAVIRLGNRIHNFARMLGNKARGKEPVSMDTFESLLQGSGLMPTEIEEDAEA